MLEHVKGHFFVENIVTANSYGYVTFMFLETDVIEQEEKQINCFQQNLAAPSFQSLGM
jgi:hypothetical protein